MSRGQSLLDALAGKTNATVVMINGSPTDNNALLLHQGQMNVLKPAIDRGDIKSLFYAPGVKAYAGTGNFSNQNSAFDIR